MVKQRLCHLCELLFLPEKGGQQRFATICPQCLREQDNQVLEAVLTLPPEEVGGGGEEVGVTEEDGDLVTIFSHHGGQRS